MHARERPVTVGEVVPDRGPPAPALPQVIGHRGAAGVAPENTLAALRTARELGAAWVEFDVKLTRDGHPILFHDDRLERTTDGAGRVADTSLVEIERLCAGGWFHPSFRGERVPTFEAALALCAELGLGINVEIKPCQGREVETARVAVEHLARHWPGHMPTPLISSFAPEALATARAVAPELPRGHLAGRLPRRWRDEMARHASATLHLNHRWLGRRQLSELRAAGVPVLPYTVNEPARARQLLDWGATAVFTDQVGAILAMLDGASGRGEGPPSPRPASA